jgi:hypothetical protein
MLVPFLSGISLVFFMLGMDVWAFSALALGSLGQSMMMYYFLVRYKEMYLGVMLAGSVCWLIGNMMWLVWGLYPLAAPWWIAFLLLVITGERLELTRFLPITQRSKQFLLVALGIFLGGIIIPFHGYGRYLAAVGLIIIGIWLLKYDMATKSVKRDGQHKFSALLLLMGYAWLIISGSMMLTGDIYGFIYDAVLHSFFIGFVFSMIFAHGPVILPGVLGISIKPYHWIICSSDNIGRFFSDKSCCRYTLTGRMEEVGRHVERNCYFIVFYGNGRVDCEQEKRNEQQGNQD